MRTLCSVLFLMAGILSAEQPAARRALTAADSAALEEPISVGRRVIVGLTHYCAETPTVTYSGGGPALLTGTPTVEILHAYRYVSDPDFAVCRRYRATLHIVPTDAPATQPLLSMQTSRGVLVFLLSGEAALESTK
jgi:hypothetical protein